MFKFLQKAIIAVVIIIQCHSDKLLLIQQIFRHGVRYPVHSSQIDGSSIINQWKSVGQLSNEGKNMHYLLGKILSDKYWKLLFQGTPYINQYNQSQFYVKSTDINRTIQSAQYHMLGWLSNLPKPSINAQNYANALPKWMADSPILKNTVQQNIIIDEINFHSIPIHVQKYEANALNEGDFLAKFDQKLCPKQYQWIQQNQNTQQYINIRKNPKVIEALQQLSKVVNKKIDKFSQVSNWVDTYYCMKYLGLPTLPIFSTQYGRTLQFILAYHKNKILFSQRQQIQTIATNLIKNILQNLRGKINGSFSPSVVIQSAHDTTIQMMLNALGMVSAQCIMDHFLNKTNNNSVCIWQYPQFSSNIIIQLWQGQKNSQKYLKILYNGVFQKIPICDNKIQCPFEQFEEWANSFMVNDVTQLCGLKDQESNNSILLIIITFLCFLVIILIVLLSQHHQNFKKKQLYLQQHHIDLQEVIQQTK